MPMVASGYLTKDKARKTRLALYHREGIIIDPHTARIQNYDDIFEDFS
jgi:threonine synthase